MKSMTGFGRARAELSSAEVFDIEVKSVNHRFLEVACKYPRTFSSSLEILIRKLISQKLKRGKIDISISARQSTNKPDQSQGFNCDLFDRYVQVFSDASSRIKAVAPGGQLSEDILKFILSQSGVVNINETNIIFDEGYEAKINSKILDAVTTAVDELLQMRITEGDLLGKTISEQLNCLQEQVQAVSRLNSDASKVVCDKLKLRIQDLLTQTDIAFKNTDEPVQQRLAQEIVLIADKVDVTEEVVRLESHISQFKQKISERSQSDSAIGRELDFLCQEVGRECNTIGSKSQITEISKIVIELKVLLEQIREQVQNIE